MEDKQNQHVEEELENLRQESLEHVQQSLEHMKRYDIRPEGKVGLFLPPEVRQQDMQRLPYEHDARQKVVYETESGEFSALCPFSGLPDFGTLRIEYVPGDWLVELKSLKYYILSWRNVGAAQEDITATIYEDLMDHLENPEHLVVTTIYNVRGGINATCTVDSREMS